MLEISLNRVDSMSRPRIHHVLNGLTACVIAWIGVYLLFEPLRVNRDAAIYLELGQYVLDGKLPYLDYYEINFPLIHFLSVIPVAVAQVLSINPVPILTICVLVLTIWTIHVIQSTTVDVLPPYMTALFGLALALAVLRLYVIMDFAQREHIFMLLYLPYFMLRWMRFRGLPARITTPGAVAIGFAAAIGAGLKPHFALFALLPELYWFLIRRDWRMFLKPELGGAALFVLLYGGYFVAFPQVTQAYMVILSDVAHGYDAYGRMKFYELLLLESPFILVAILPWLRRTLPDVKEITSLSRSLSLIIMGGVLIYILQGKGWLYHNIPTRLAFYLVVVIEFSVYARRLQTQKALVSWSSLLFIALILCYPQVFLGSRLEADSVQVKIGSYIAEHTSADDKVIIVDTNPYPIFQSLLYANRHSASSYTVAYAFPFEASSLGSDEVPPGVQHYFETLAVDIQQKQPALIMIRNIDSCFGCPQDFNIHEYLEENQFVQQEILTAYQPAGQFEQYAVFMREN